MFKSELIAKLQQSIDECGDGSISEKALMELAFAGSRALSEWKAREAIVLDIIRAKRDAGFPRDSVFFKDIWPVALAALRAQRRT